MIERGDEAFHRPSGESWVVKRAGEDSDGAFVEPAGWPACRARAADCDLVAKGKHLDFLDAKKRKKQGMRQITHYEVCPLAHAALLNAIDRLTVAPEYRDDEQIIEDLRAVAGSMKSVEILVPPTEPDPEQAWLKNWPAVDGGID